MVRALAWAAALLAGSQAAAQVPPLAPSETLLLVQGTGEAKAVPDLVTIEVGVVTVDQTAGEAQDSNNREAQRLLAAVRAAGVADLDARTTELSVSPRYSDKDGEAARIIGFTAVNRLSVRLQNVANAGDVISALFEAGANQVRGPNFSLTSDGEPRRVALTAAVADARINANVLASTLGKRVARVLKVRDSRVSEDGANGIIVTGSRITRTPLAVGEVTFKASVSVEFALAD